MTLYAGDALVKSVRRASVALYLVSVTRLYTAAFCCCVLLDVMHCLPLLNNSSDVCQWNLYTCLRMLTPLNMTGEDMNQQMLQLIQYRQRV